MSDSFWTKVKWSNFIGHFRKLTDEQIVKDINESMDALENNDASGGSFGSKMVMWANERRKGKPADASRENGNLGGRPKKNGSARPVTDAPTREDGENNDNGGDTSAPVNLESANIRDEKITGTTKNRDDAGDATTRKDVEDSPMRGCVAIPTQQLKSGTSSAPSTLAELANNVKSKKEAEESEKEAFGEFKHVLLTNEEWWKLATKLGKDGLKKSIEKLDTYLENNPKKLKGKGAYKSHYAAIIQWTADAVAESDKKKADAAAAEKRLENAQNSGQKYMTAAEKQLIEAKKTAEVVRKIREEAALKEAEVIIRG